MNIQNTLDLIPTDVLHEIFSRLPAKSVGRCRCVSKKLASVLCSEDFKQLFLTRSLTRPRLLFVFEQKWSWWVFYSSPRPQNEKSSLVLTAQEGPILKAFDFKYASGLFYFYDFLSTNKDEDYTSSHAICNPSTGQYVILPKLRSSCMSYTSFLGFDPINKQFKILFMNTTVNNERINYILTLGTGQMRWRTIECPLLCDYSYIHREGVCINGVLYCLSRDTDNGVTSFVIVCFDVRTETLKSKFNVIGIQGYNVPRLINCKGKLDITILRESYDSVELDMWVVEEDVEKPQWSKYSLPTMNTNDVYVVGMTSTGEIVLSTICKPFYLYYFNLEKKSHQSVEVQGYENDDYPYVIMDHVEDLYVNDAKYFKSNNI